MFVHRSPQQTCSLKEELSAIAEAELVYNWDKSEHYILAKPLLSSARVSDCLLFFLHQNIIVITFRNIFK